MPRLRSVRTLHIIYLVSGVEAARKDDGKMTAQDFANEIQAPVVFFTSTGYPHNRVAILESTELPFSLSQLSGEVVDGKWYWDGERYGDGYPTDWHGNDVTLLTICSDKEEWELQYNDYMSEG
jgi:hypothetical protein